MSERERRDAQELVEAYHDGELSGLARRRFEGALRRSPELRRELAELAALRRALCEREAREPGPDLWDAVALRLPALDAWRRAGARARGGLAGWAWMAKPLAAAAATALVAAGALLSWPRSQPTRAVPVVRWLDSGDRNVMVLEESSDTTIIWVFDDASTGVSTGSRGVAREVV
jgi:anti-sigma-K factor RskA